jgi:hypothetical protein
MPVDYNNTVSDHPTHFLAAVPLIVEARSTFSVPSENWGYPTNYRLGSPNDFYYAEVWVDGMDWQQSYWVIESVSFNSPKVYPLVVFEDDKVQINDHDLKLLILALITYRRSVLWTHQDDQSRYHDSVWVYMKTLGITPPPDWGQLCEFEHGSQQAVRFLANKEFIPPHKMQPVLEYTSKSGFMKFGCQVNNG